MLAQRKLIIYFETFSPLQFTSRYGKGERASANSFTLSHIERELKRVDDHERRGEGKWSVGLVTKIFICSARQDIAKLVLSNCNASDGNGQKVDLSLTLDLKFTFLTSSVFLLQDGQSCDPNFLTIETNIAPVIVDVEKFQRILTRNER